MCLTQPKVEEEISTIEKWNLSKNEAPFHKVAQNGKLEYVTGLVGSGVNINSHCISGQLSNMCSRVSNE